MVRATQEVAATSISRYSTDRANEQEAYNYFDSQAAGRANQATHNHFSVECVEEGTSHTSDALQLVQLWTKKSLYQSMPFKTTKLQPKLHELEHESSSEDDMVIAAISKWTLILKKDWQETVKVYN